MLNKHDLRDHWKIHQYHDDDNWIDVYRTACVVWLSPTFELLVSEIEKKYYQPRWSPIDWDNTPHLMQTKNEDQFKFNTGELVELEERITHGSLSVTIERWLVGYDLSFRVKARIVNDYKNDNAMVVHIFRPDIAEEFARTLHRLFDGFNERCSTG